MPPTRQSYRHAGQLIQSGVATIPPLAPSADRPAWIDSAMVLNRRLGWLPSMTNNSAELFHVYEESIQAKADLVLTAQRFVHVEYFMLCRDSTTELFIRALLDVAARGVKVRVLFEPGILEDRLDIPFFPAYGRDTHDGV